MRLYDPTPLSRRSAKDGFVDSDSPRESLHYRRPLNLIPPANYLAAVSSPVQMYSNHRMGNDCGSKQDQQQAKEKSPKRAPPTLPNRESEVSEVTCHEELTKPSGLTTLLGNLQEIDSERDEKKSHGGPLTDWVEGDSARDSLVRQASVFEADTASGPVFIAPNSCPTNFPGQSFPHRRPSAGMLFSQPLEEESHPSGVPPSPPLTLETQTRFPLLIPPPGNKRRYSVNSYRASTHRNQELGLTEKMKRSISQSNCKTVASPSSSPYALLLHQKEAIHETMNQRLTAARELRPSSLSPVTDKADEATVPTGVRGNDARNRRRAEHNRAVIDELCEIVTDLFISESKLLNPESYGVQDTSFQRKEVLATVQKFISDLPPRYALGVDTPSEVLVHMRLMAAVRADDTRAAVHIVSLGENLEHMARPQTNQRKEDSQSSLKLVTISCRDEEGLLGLITKLLGTGGSRVVDADVMLSRDSVTLDRFVVKMNGRLRLDKLQHCIEEYLKDAASSAHSQASPSLEDSDEDRNSSKVQGSSSPATKKAMFGPLYYKSPIDESNSPSQLKEQMQSAVPLSDVVKTSISTGSIPALKQMRPNSTGSKLLKQAAEIAPAPPKYLSRFLSAPIDAVGASPVSNSDKDTPDAPVDRRSEELVNRKASHFCEATDQAVIGPSTDYAVRDVPYIPFEELMLIDTLGSGRVSTIYKAAWKERHATFSDNPDEVTMVALKVATVDANTGDTSNIEELISEADIAAMLDHDHICSLVGVASDQECFCLAYEFCQGGSLHHLLSDGSRCYEYLPIALDIASGMAYLHSRNVIHRDLKPSNILLTKDNRAKIADFGMSVANKGQDLTAETGTYRWMAPEVIRHESYSSNADVYSFGIVLWQLVTRENPFASLTPVQTAYAVAEGHRPEIPPDTPERLREIICACWDEDSHRRPSFTYIAMALADYAKMAFHPANVGAQTVQIANEMLATVQGNSTVNVDFSTPLADHRRQLSFPAEFDNLEVMNRGMWWANPTGSSYSNSTSNVGLEI